MLNTGRAGEEGEQEESAHLVGSLFSSSHQD